MNIQHDLLKELLDGNYVGPVRDVLARRSSQRQIKVLDLCTGTGKWYVTPCICILGLILDAIFAGWSKWRKNSLTSDSMDLI
jgi:hypothetical protein